jgi:hypothetical protein
MAPTEDDQADEVDASVEERQRRERRALLDELTREAEEMGLYDDPPPDYRAALKEARRRRARGSRASE